MVFRVSLITKIMLEPKDIDNLVGESDFRAQIRVLKVLQNELSDIPNAKDFASRAGDAEGYARICGQEVLLERLIKKFSND